MMAKSEVTTKRTEVLWRIVAFPFILLCTLFMAWIAGIGWMLYSVWRVRKWVRSKKVLDFGNTDPFGYYHPLSFYRDYGDMVVPAMDIWTAWRVVQKNPLQINHLFDLLKGGWSRRTLLWRSVRRLALKYYDLLGSKDSNRPRFTYFFKATAVSLRDLSPGGNKRDAFNLIKQVLMPNPDQQIRNWRMDDSHWIISAAMRGDTNEIETRGNKESNLEIEDDNRWTPLFHAAAHRHVDTLKTLIERQVNADTRDILGHTPLSIASRYGFEDVAKILIEAGADLENREDVLGRTPLMIAVYCDHLPIVEILVTAGANVNAADDLGATPLIIAVSENRRGIVNYLITHGAKLGLVDVNGETPLMEAVRGPYADVLKDLLEAGADVSNRNNEGKTALDIALDGDRREKLINEGKGIPDLDLIDEILEKSSERTIP